MVNEEKAKEREEEYRKQNAESAHQHQEGMIELQKQMNERNKVHEEKMKKLNKVIEMRNYERHVPEPGFLKKHKLNHPKSFYVQILGCRGAGKSTFVTKFLRLAQGNNSKGAQRDAVECTLETEFFDITDCIEDTGPYNNVFLVDQPGIGGLKVTEAAYLEKFGPGHFNWTFMLGEKGNYRDL